MPILAEASLETIRRDGQILSGSPRDYDALLQRIGDAKFVLIGEASRGDSEALAGFKRFPKRDVAPSVHHQ